jgi:hypothetical protein
VALHDVGGAAHEGRLPVRGAHGATHLVLDTYIGNGKRSERLYVKMGFEQLTEPYADPDYLWK